MKWFRILNIGMKHSLQFMYRRDLRVYVDLRTVLNSCDYRERTWFLWLIEPEVAFTQALTMPVLQEIVVQPIVSSSREYKVGVAARKWTCLPGSTSSTHKLQRTSINECVF